MPYYDESKKVGYKRLIRENINFPNTNKIKGVIYYFGQIPVRVVLEFDIEDKFI